MSVTTTADELKRDAREHISQAIKSLMEFCDDDTWGHSDYPDVYIDDILNVIGDLLKIKKKL